MSSWMAIHIFGAFPYRLDENVALIVLRLMLKVHELKMEKKKADALTYQMLPPTVARVAIVMPHTIASKRQFYSRMCKIGSFVANFL